jgi:hypothetical protein
MWFVIEGGAKFERRFSLMYQHGMVKWISSLTMTSWVGRFSLHPISNQDMVENMTTVSDEECRN